MTRDADQGKRMNGSELSRHVVTTLLLWLGLTAIGEALVFLNPFPTIGSDEASDFDHIFRVLMYMGMPVLTFVFAVLGYSIIAFRGRGRDDAGLPIRGTGAVPRIWLAVTGGLVALVMVYPGLTGLAELQASPTGYGWGASQGDLLVKVTGFRYSWQFDYPDSGVSFIGATGGNELVLPIDTDVHFEITSIDVIHSFWIPAFRTKIDAVPGRTTTMTVRPTQLSSTSEDVAFRVQCAELCGVDHSLMAFPVRIVEKDAFAAWLAERDEGNPSTTATPTGVPE